MKYTRDCTGTLSVSVAIQIYKEAVVPRQCFPAVSDEGREEVLVGSGDGNVFGEKIYGTVRWALYAGDCADAGQHICTPTICRCVLLITRVQGPPTD